MTPVLALHDAALTLGGRTLWSNLDLEVQPGEFVAVLGANGSGKTSLLKMILGQHRLTTGNVEFEGQPRPVVLHGAEGFVEVGARHVGLPPPAGDRLQRGERRKKARQRGVERVRAPRRGLAG